MNIEAIGITKKYPNDIDLEYQLIGCVLYNSDLLSHISFLKSDDFYSAIHGDIWKAITALYAAGDSITPFTVTPLLEDADALAENGGATRYIGASMTPSVLCYQPVEAAKYLLKLSQKRVLIHSCLTVAEQAADMHSPVTVTQHAAQLSKAIEHISYSPEVNEFENAFEIGAQILKDLADNKKPYSTGIKKLDIAMDGGLYPCKSYGFAARKKVGKTALAATISGNLNMAGVKHLFIAGEMSSKEIHQRVLARTADVFPSAFRQEYGKSTNCNVKLADAVRKLPKNALYKNAQGIVFDELRRIATVAVDRYEVKGIILDYWQLVGGKQKGQSTAEHLDNVAQWIADFSRRNNIWTITMAQLNQEDNTRGGEGIRLAFDQLYQLHRENLTEPESWLEMMETRYTPWVNIEGLMMMEKGPYFAEIARN